MWPPNTTSSPNLGVSVDLAGELAVDLKPFAAVHDAVSGDLGCALPGLDLEGHEVAEIELPQHLQSLEDRFLCPEQDDVDICRRSRATEPDLEREPALEPALEHDVGPEALCEPSEQALKHQQLTPALDPRTGGAASQPFFERLLEIAG
jgi:hypothetical protein